MQKASYRKTDLPDWGIEVPDSEKSVYGIGYKFEEK